MGSGPDVGLSPLTAVVPERREVGVMSGLSLSTHRP